MKILDRYLYTSFLTPLIYCLLAFGMIYVIYDLFDNMQDFIHAETPLPEIVRYYLMLQPAVMIYIVPISLMLSELYTLSHMTKNNEITAMRACGISLYRIIAPFILISLFASITVAIVHETVGPWAAWNSEQFVSSQTHKGKQDVHVAENFPYKNEAANRIWFISTFHKKQFNMKTVRVTQQREDQSDEFQILADKAEWLDGRWWFTDVSIQAYDPQGNPMGPPRFEKRREMIELTEQPKDFLNEIKDPAYLSSLELHHYIQTHKTFSERDLVKYRVDMQHRLSLPWTCLIVSLLGIPFGHQTGRKGALMGIVLCLSLFFGYYFIVNVFLALGKKQAVSPLIAAWTPNFSFLVLSLFLIRRMR